MGTSFDFQDQTSLESILTVCDIIGVYKKTRMGACGGWSSTKIALLVDHHAQSVVLPRKHKTCHHCKF